MALGLWSLIALYVSFELARFSASFGEIWGDVTFRYSVGALLQRNIVASILRKPGAVAPPVSSGEAVSRFRDDVGEVADFPLWTPHVIGEVLGSAIAIAIMARINLFITLVIFVPLVASVIASRMAWGRLQRYRHASRVATDRVTGFMGELFGAVQAIKVANAERDVVAHFRTLNDARRRATLKDRLFGELLQSINGTAVTFGIGVTLLLAGRAMSAGTFTVGDFALFVYYLWFTAELPGTIGAFIGDYKQQEVAIERLEELVQPEPANVLVQQAPIYADGLLPAVPVPEKHAEDRLERLHVSGLTYRFPGTDNGIKNVDLSLTRGSFTVVTGRIGSGKTTLLRTLLGLLPRDGGIITWNGVAVDDAATFFVPPRSSYTPQVPRLFSEPLRDNILMGLPEQRVDLPGALRLGVLEQDVTVLERGLETVVGPRGVRLSGGQVQRAAAVRMFVRDPELLVFDDLSSALDVETERSLWERLEERRAASTMGAGGAMDGGTVTTPTCLAVSHRRAALRRADQIVVLKHGRVDAVGTLDELLPVNHELQRLWRGDVGDARQVGTPGTDELATPSFA